MGPPPMRQQIPALSYQRGGGGTTAFGGRGEGGVGKHGAATLRPLLPYELLPALRGWRRRGSEAPGQAVQGRVGSTYRSRRVLHHEGAAVLELPAVA